MTEVGRCLHHHHNQSLLTTFRNQSSAHIIPERRHYTTHHSNNKSLFILKTTLLIHFASILYTSPQKELQHIFPKYTCGIHFQNVLSHAHIYPQALTLLKSHCIQNTPQAHCHQNVPALNYTHPALQLCPRSYSIDLC